MKKPLIIILIIGAVLGGYFFFSKGGMGTNDSSDIQITNKADVSSPSRPAEVNGTVLSVEGNIILLANEVGKEQLTEEERDERKEEIQDLTQEERQLQRQQELEEMDVEDMEIIIPVGVTITKGSGSSTGETIIAEISDIEKGTYLSIWLTESSSPEFVKIKGIGQ